MIRCGLSGAPSHERSPDRSLRVIDPETGNAGRRQRICRWTGEELYIPKAVQHNNGLLNLCGRLDESLESSFRGPGTRLA